MTPTDRWLGKLSALRPAQGKTKEQGAAPHKPLLLLCLIDLAEAGQITTRAFTRTPGLVLRFRTYGTLVSERWPSKLDLKLPFYHLGSQGFWEPFTGDMRKATGPDNCLFCELHEEFFQLLSDADFRLKARLVLISRHFAPIERISLFETLGLEGSQAGATAAERVLQTALESAKRKGRCAKFQVRIVDDYRHTCALTGYRCFTVDGSSVVDAAHIESWSQTQNDDLGNGLALSKTAHWMFDEGLWTVDDNLRVIVHPQRFTEAGPEALQLRTHAGRHLQFDPQAKLRPSMECLRAHRLRAG